MPSVDRAVLLPEPELPPADALLAAGRALAKDWSVGPSAFLEHVNAPSEAVYKRRQVAAGRLMQHAQVGYRDLEKSRRAYAEIHEQTGAQGVRVDRYGLCLDWAMGYPPAWRDRGPCGTGMMLRGPEDFVRLTAAAPVAPHFGDFVLGFPGAVETTQAALAAGSTAIGNLGQYFTFRLPGWDDELATATATLTALGLIAAQPVEVLVHSNLDDGFAALFTDLACCLGAALIEKYLVEDLVGAKVAHCYGHHFSDPLTRLAFQRALARANDTPGTMIYGNTVSYRGGPAANYASLSSYLLSDIMGQRLEASGHAINPVPVTENHRIPDIDEVVDAQLFAARLIEHADGYEPVIDVEAADRIAARLLDGAEAFRDRVLAGLAEAAVQTDDALELMLALRRLGAKRLEELYGPGIPDQQATRGRRPVVPSTTISELEQSAAARLAAIDPAARERIAAAGLTAIVATTDVHEHGKLLVEKLLQGLGVGLIDGGVSTDPDRLAGLAAASKADLVALSTYNGVALRFVEDLKQELSRQDAGIPLLVGGRLNQILPASNSSLPVDVTAELAALGAVVCREAEDVLPALLEIAARHQSTENKR